VLIHRWDDRLANWSLNLSVGTQYSDVSRGETELKRCPLKAMHSWRGAFLVSVVTKLHILSLICGIIQKGHFYSLWKSPKLDILECGINGLIQNVLDRVTQELTHMA